jgi:hypothetical protein
MAEGIPVADANFLSTTVQRLDLVTDRLSSVLGYDRALAFVMYGARMVAHFRERNHIGTKDTVEALRKLSGSLAQTRTIFRFRGTFPYISQLLKSGVLTGDTPLLQKIQVISMLLYYPLEHIYFLGSMGLLNIKPKNVLEASRWSCTFWFVYTFLEVFNVFKDFLKFKRNVRLLGPGPVDHAATLNEKNAPVDEKVKHSLENVSQAQNQLSQEAYLLIKRTVSLSCFLPMSLHFSLKKSPFPQLFIDILGFIAAINNYL